MQWVGSRPARLVALWAASRQWRSTEQASDVLNSRHDAGEVFLPDPIGMSVCHPGSSSRNAFAARKSGVSNPSMKRP